MIAPFPTDYQLEQIGKLVLVEQNPSVDVEQILGCCPFSCDRAGRMDQQTLFNVLCRQLQDEGFVDAEFLDSVVERRPSSAPCWVTALPCRTPSVCWQRKRWSTPSSPRGVSPGGMKRRSDLPASPSAKANTKKRWRSTIFSSPSCASAP